MRYAIFSDIHSNLEAFEAVIQALGKESIDRYFCVGDVVGYAANPCECIQKLKAIASITVAGNHDWASVNLFPLECFNLPARKAVAWTALVLKDEDKEFLRGLKPVYHNEDLTLVHSTLNQPEVFNYLIDLLSIESTFSVLKNNICFVGHSHIPAIFYQDAKGNICLSKEKKIQVLPGNKFIVNVGSIGQPRDGNPEAAYCIYDTKTMLVEIKRAIYNVELTKQKIISAGLSVFLGERLLVGR